MEIQVVNALISTSDGDLRRAITYLQSAARLASASDQKSAITARQIQEIAGVVPDAVVRRFAASLGIESEDASDDMDVDQGVDTAAVRAGLLKGGPATGFTAVKAQVKLIMRDGYSVAQLLYQVSPVSHK